MRLKYILTLLVLAFPAYTVARHCVLKYFQWQAFYKLEEEVLAEVTSDDFLERVLEIGPEYSRADIIDLSGFGHGLPYSFGDPDGLYWFLENIHPQSDQEFIVVKSITNETLNLERQETSYIDYYSYPVTVCGNRYCPFDKSKLSLARPDGERPKFDVSGIGDSYFTLVDGFEFRVSRGVMTRPEKKLVRLTAYIAVEAISWIDRLNGQMTQRDAPNYWASTRIYEKNYVMDWEAYRGE